MNRDTAIEYAKVLKALIELNKLSKIINTFIKAFVHNTVQKEDGFWYLFGNFNLGGTVSGRVSSSKINLQQLPSTGSEYAKAIKQCFKAPPGYILVGADFSSLEDRISALTTKDPNKLKVYTDGYDGHCLRAYTYFSNQMPDIVDTVESINSIETKYPELRQDSKSPTFALTYQGTWKTLVKNVGIPKTEAQQIEKQYHTLYEVSDKWVQNKIQLAAQNGYTTVAFGLRVRTPILGQSVVSGRYTPREALAEGRTMGNAHGQSYGMLNNRTYIELQQRLLDSDEKLNIFPIAHIHDAGYFIIKDSLKTIKWLNDNLIECMQWQELPEIQHPTVKLGGELTLFYPTWADSIKLPNNASKTEIVSLVKKTLKERKKK